MSCWFSVEAPHCLHVDIGQAVNVGHNVQKFIHSLHSGKHRSANAEKTHLIGVIDIMRRTAQSRFIHQRVCFRKRVDVALQQLFGRRGNRIGFGHRGGQQFDLLALPFLLDAQRKLHLKFLIPLQLQHLAKTEYACQAYMAGLGQIGDGQKTHRLGILQRIVRHLLFRLGKRWVDRLDVEQKIVVERVCRHLDPPPQNREYLLLPY